MNYSARQYFPNWCTRAGYETDAATIEARLRAIDQIMVKADEAYWLDVIKLAFNIRVSGTNVNDFVEVLVKEEPAFPLTDNQNILRYIASALLAIYFDEQNSVEAMKVALSVNAAVFLGQYDLANFGHVILYAGMNLHRRSVTERSYDLASAESNLVAIESAHTAKSDATPAKITGTEFNSLVSVTHGMLTANKALMEEVNIHWWLFGQYSAVAEESFASVPVTKMIFLSGLELSGLTKFDSNLNNSIQFLRKAIQLSNGGKTAKKSNIYEVITALLSTDRELILKNVEAKASFLTPLILAIKSAAEVTSGDDWSIHFKAISNNGEPKKEADNERIADQLYKELLLLRL